MSQRRARVLYVEKPVAVGGSVISLLELVRGLDTDRYEPVVLFFGPNPYRERFTTLGVGILVLGQMQPANASQVKSRRDIAASLSRYNHNLADAYRAAKDVYLLVRRDMRQARQLARLIRREAIDLVHHNNGLSGSRDGVLAARMVGVPQVCHIRMLHPPSPVERRLARWVDAFIYISTAVERLYCDHGIPAAKGRVVHNPIAVDKFGRADGVNGLRTELGLAANDRVISNIGRLDWWKGHEVFLSAMAQVVQAEPAAKALIVGEADDTPMNRAYAEALHQMVSDLQLSDRVVFAGYRVDIPRIMKISDVVVHSASRPEPFGRVIGEAMAAGRPVVASAAGGVLDIVDHGVNGLLVSPGDTASMANAILRILRNDELARTLAQRGQERARTCFSVEQHVSGVQSVYQGLLAA